jgi:tRNA-modifying protein YgfZ
MWQLGRPRRRLALVEAARPVAAGDELGQGRKRVTVTSATRSGEQALAFVPGDAEVDASYEGEEGQVLTVRDLVGEGRPVPGADPNVTRRRDTRAS